MKSVETEGNTIEEAVQAALAELGASEAEVDVAVLSDKGRGFLGLGGAKAKVRVTIREGVAERARQLVAEIVDRLAPGATVEAFDADDHLLVTVEGENLGILIGRHGQTLDAVQQLVGIGANKGLPDAERRRVVVDAERYRERRKEELEDLAERLASKVAATGRPAALRPMAAYERRVVHVRVSEHEGVESSSEGEGPERHVVIRPA